MELFNPDFAVVVDDVVDLAVQNAFCCKKVLKSKKYTLDLFLF